MSESQESDIAVNHFCKRLLKDMGDQESAMYNVPKLWRGKLDGERMGYSFSTRVPHNAGEPVDNYCIVDITKEDTDA